MSRANFHTAPSFYLTRLATLCHRSLSQAHVLLHILHGCPSTSDSSLIKGAPGTAPTRPSFFTLKPGGSKPSIRKVTEADVAAALQQSCVETDGLFDNFRKKASAEVGLFSQSKFSVTVSPDRNPNLDRNESSN
jgi:hypothetical protein